MKDRIPITDRADADIVRGSANRSRIDMRGQFDVECLGPDGRVKWRDSFRNLVTNAGEDDVLDKYFKGSAYTAAHYVGLTDATPTTAETDTMASHTGWAEDQNYSETVRQTLTMGTVSGQSVDNSASKASFSINGTTTIGGAFVTDSNTKGGTTGVLYSVGAFTGGNKAVGNGDTLNVTYTATAGGA